MRTEQLFKPHEIWSVCLALGLLLSGASAAQAEDCAPPPPWSEADAHRGPPRAEVEACVEVQAWEARNLSVPTDSVASGIVSQCEVKVTFAAGPPGSASRTRVQQLLDANDRVALDQALDDVTRARRCAGR